MSELLNSGEVGNIQIRQLQEQRKQVVSRWKKTGLLEGLNSKKAGIIAQLLENQAGYLLEAPANALSNGQVSGFDIVAFPMVRRVFSRLLANDIVSVQPMNLPSGLLFYLDSQVETNAHAGTYQSVYDAHYGNLGWDNSYGTGSTVTHGALTAITTMSTSGYVDVPYTGGEKGLSSIVLYAHPTTATTAASTSGVCEYAILPQTWTLDLLNRGFIRLAVNTGYTVTSDSTTSATTMVWIKSAVYQDLEANADMAEVKLIVTSVTVSVKTRKMKAHWTPELAQDLAAYHSIDAEAELTALLSEELAAEIDREIIRDLIIVAPWKTKWSYARNAAVKMQDGTLIAADPASGYITQKEWNQTLMTQINKISAQIHKTTLRGGANFLVVSTEIGSVLEDIEKFHAVNEAEAQQFNMGIEQIGTLGTRYTVYKDPYLPSHICLVGHKGSSFLDTGYVYAPYIPFQLTPVVLDPDDFTPRKGIMTRYAKKVVNNKYYGVVEVVFPDSYYVVNAS